MRKHTLIIDANCLVDDVMREHPATIRAFIDARMNCVGCPIGSFHTIDDACREHGVDRERFLEALRDIAMAGEAFSSEVESTSRQENASV